MGDVEAELHGRGDLIDILPARAGGADEFLMDFFLTDRDRAVNSTHAFSVPRVGFSGKPRFFPGPERTCGAFDLQSGSVTAGGLVSASSRQMN